MGLHLPTLEKNHQYAIDQVMRKIRAGKSVSNTLPATEFTWVVEASAPAGSKANDLGVVLSCVLVAIRKGSSWRSEQLLEVPERASSAWRYRTAQKERRADLKQNKGTGRRKVW